MNNQDIIAGMNRAQQNINEFTNISLNDVSDMEAAVKQYLETAIWASGEDFDGLTIYDFSDYAVNTAITDLSQFIFQAKQRGLIGESTNLTDVAHDFWLTRNGHGAGFWDGDWDELGDDLTALSKEFDEIYISICEPGDDTINLIICQSQENHKNILPRRPRHLKMLKKLSSFYQVDR